MRLKRLTPDITRIRLLTAIFLVMLVGAAFGSYIYLEGVTDDSLRNALLEQQAQRQMGQTKSLSQHISSDLDSIILHLHLLADSPAVQSGDFAGSQVSELLDATHARLSSITTIQSVHVFNDKGVNSAVSRDEYEPFIGADFSAREYVVETKARLGSYITNGFEGADGALYVVVTAPIISRQSGEYMGLVSAGFKTIEFFERYGNVLDIDSEVIVALDRDGTYLSAALPEYLGKDFFSEEIQERLNRNPQLYKAYSDSVVEGRISTATFDVGLGERFVVAAPVVVGGEQVMTVATSTPLAAVYSQVESILFAHRVQTLTLLGGLFAAVAVIVVLLARWGSSLDRLVAKKTEQLQEANAVLEAANEKLILHDRLQREFINVAAHELRTPIQPLLGVASLIESELAGRDRTEISKSRLDMIIRNAKRLQRLSSDILEVSRIEGQSLKLNKQVIDLKANVLQVIEDCKSFIASGRPLEIVFEPSGDDDEKKPVLVEADQSRLFEVISNLMRNAIKFTEEGTISVRIEEKGGEAVVAVRDTGKGIDPEILPRLFTKFASKSEQGTGLGLYISKSIIDAHGGRMWAENNADGKGGATFWFSLPLAKAPENEKALQG